MTTDEPYLREPTAAELEEAASVLNGLRFFQKEDGRVRWIAACLRLA